jgi:hypothetical protein
MLDTWGGRSTFDYDWCVLAGTTIRYGKGSEITVTVHDYEALRAALRGQIVQVGTSRTSAPAGSLGAWLQANVTRTAIASYVAPILVREGYAVREDDTSIRIVR